MKIVEISTNRVAKLFTYANYVGLKHKDGSKGDIGGRLCGN